MNTKNILIGIFAVLFMIVFLLFFIVPPAQQTGSMSNEKSLIEPDDTDNIQVEMDDRLGFYKNDFFLIGKSIKKIDFKNKELIDTENYHEIIAKTDRDTFYQTKNNIFRASDEKMVFEAPSDYSFRGEYALFLKDHKMFLYTIKDDTLHPLLENFDTSYIRSLDQVKLLRGDAYYTVYNPDTMTSTCYETYTDRILKSKKEWISDTSDTRSTFLMVLDKDNYFDVTEYNIEEAKGERYNLVQPEQKSLSEPKYYNEKTIYFMTKDEVDTYLNFYDTSKKELVQFKLDTASKYQSIFNRDGELYIAYTDRYYFGTPEKIDMAMGAFHDILEQDKGKVFVSDLSIRFVRDGYFKEYQLFGAPVSYVYDNGYFTYIYRKSSKFFVSRIEVD